MTVNVENMTAFVAALRSGDYRQTTCQLRDKHPGDDGKYGYCCLGVATDLAIKAGALDEHGWGMFGEDSIWNSHGVLPVKVKNWLGVDRDNPYIATDPAGGRFNASYCNDTYGWSFLKIADAFEDTYLKAEAPASVS